MRINKRKQKVSEDKELRAYYDRTSSLESGDKIESIRMAFPKPRRLIALRVDEEILSAVKKLAASKGLNYSTLMRMWIAERLAHERGGQR